MTTFYSNGKLLLTGEYAILDGAVGLALPTKYGQSLDVTELTSPLVHWRSFNHIGNIWFEGDFDLDSLIPIEEASVSRENTTATTLSKILLEARKLNPSFLNDGKGYQIETHLDFPEDWGLGSSSTLITNVAQWAKVDAYTLLWNAFTGSGYDIACAQSDSPLLYRLKNSQPEVDKVAFDPSFKDNLFFIHLNKKQNSREGIARYRSRAFDKTELEKNVSALTKAFLSCARLSEFEHLITQHETLISEALDLPTVKTTLFSDYSGAIKSLGAWGGDFVLATGDFDAPNYFKEKGYDTVIPFSKMIL
ncbi:GYDIA family GHMP kinase [Maribacter sp.]|nr:GYDIA family GHMP kinase [Maribacter sp.]